MTKSRKVEHERSAIGANVISSDQAERLLAVIAMLEAVFERAIIVILCPPKHNGNGEITVEQFTRLPDDAAAEILRELTKRQMQ